MGTARGQGPRARGDTIPFHFVGTAPIAQHIAVHARAAVRPTALVPAADTFRHNRAQRPTAYHTGSWRLRSKGLHCYPTMAFKTAEPLVYRRLPRSYGFMLEPLGGAALFGRHMRLLFGRSLRLLLPSFARFRLSQSTGTRGGGHGSFDPKQTRNHELP